MTGFSKEIVKVKIQWNKFKEKKQVNQGFYVPQNFFKNKGKINAFIKTKTEIIRSQTCYKTKAYENPAS